MQWAASREWGHVLGEVAIAIHEVTGDVRILGFDIDRKYKEHGATDEEICGSVDIVSWVNGELVVYDWKFGWNRKLSRYKNPQIRTYAAALSKLLNLSYVVTCLVVVNEDGVFPYIETVPREECDEIIRGLLDLNTELTLGDPQPRPGPHCGEKYCSLRATCPALNEVAMELKKTIPVPLATHEDVARTIEKLYALEAQAKAIWELVDARVAELGDIELSGGKVYGPKETARESVMATEGARAYLVEKLGPAIDEAVKVTVTKDSIKEACKAAAPKGKAAALYREIEQELRDRGSIKVNISTSVGLK